MFLHTLKLKECYPNYSVVLVFRWIHINPNPILLSFQFLLFSENVHAWNYIPASFLQHWLLIPPQRASFLFWHTSGRWTYQKNHKVAMFGLLKHSPWIYQCMPQLMSLLDKNVSDSILGDCCYSSSLNFISAQSSKASVWTSLWEAWGSAFIGSTALLSRRNNLLLLSPSPGVCLGYFWQNDPSFCSNTITCLYLSCNSFPCFFYPGF